MEALDLCTKRKIWIVFPTPRKVRIKIIQKKGKKFEKQQDLKIKKNSLRTGDTEEGEMRAPRESERYFAITKIDKINNSKETGNNQKDILFILGNAISGAPIIIGTNQLPNPPIIAGITIKKIMIKP